MLRNNTLSRADLSDDRKGILDIHYGDVLVRYGAVLDISMLQGPSINITDNRFLGDQLTDGDIIMADTAEDASAGKCVEIGGVMQRNVVAGLHTIPLRPVTPSSHGYWGQYLNSASFRNQLFSKMQGTKVISLSRTAVSDATVRCPAPPEQRCIGDFFSTVDSLIAAAERQEALLRQKKQAYLQLMFPREGETEPRMRFAEFSGEWKQRQLGDVAEKVTEKNSGLAYQQVLTNSATHGIVRQSEYFDRIVAGKNHLDAYYVVSPNDYVYNPRISREAPCGPINRNNLELTGIASPLYLVFRVSSQSVVYEFLDQYFKTANWFNYMKLQGNSGARSDRFTIADSGFFSMPVRIPSLLEQRRIGEFFSALDNLIVAAEQRAESLRALKSAYLQRMFV